MAYITLRLRKKALKLRADGLSLRKIGERLNVSHQTVKLWLDAEKANIDRVAS